jgi:hypothetical protein
MSSNDGQFLEVLQSEIEAELVIVEADGPDLSVPSAEWLFDPTDLEREEVGLRNLLAATKVLEGATDPAPPL